MLKILKQNIQDNLDIVFKENRGKNKSSSSGGGGRGEKAKNSNKHPGPGNKSTSSDRISCETLDWEISSVSHFPPVDLIIACVCIYNESLIEPLNTTCAALCRSNQDTEKPTVCLIAQQLRSPEVFEAWLKSFCRSFEVWQVPDGLLDEGLREGSGFVVHVGVLR